MRLKVWNQYLNLWENCFELRTEDEILKAYIEDDINECEVEAQIVLGTETKDCNNKNIYCGDILKYTRKNWYCPGHSEHNKDLINYCLVYWDKEKQMFCNDMREDEKINGRIFCSGKLGFCDERADKNIVEIVGNIYENPELLNDVKSAEGEKE